MMMQKMKKAVVGKAKSMSPMSKGSKAKGAKGAKPMAMGMMKSMMRAKKGY